MGVAPFRRIDLWNLPPGARLAAFVDTETTGLSQYDEIVELAVVLFVHDGQTVLGIADEYAGLRAPTIPIPAKVTAINGITNEMVRLQVLDLDRIKALLLKAEVIIAHNADFDRRFLVRLLPYVGRRKWRCSMNGVKWYDHGYKSKGLQNLLRAHEIPTTQAHRATSDIYAALQLLNCTSLAGDQTYLAELCRARPLPTLKAAPGRLATPSESRNATVSPQTTPQKQMPIPLTPPDDS